MEHYVAVKLGLIPAHAGKTRPDVSLSDRERAHPRSRGENFGVELAKLCAQGSSPLTRGKPPVSDFAPYRVGLIPAHAGKTSPACSSTPPQRAHPRSRGENSPRPPRHANPSGLIPAHAGKTVSGALRFVVAGAHPRSRGENMVTAYNTRTGAGSSPLTRGKLHDVARNLLASRLIPAHAGKTALSSSSPIRLRAHPRSRGENHGEHFGGGLIEGSSPLTRGKRPGLGLLLRRPGLIPAHAGKTDEFLSESHTAGAHPRSRGENRSEPRLPFAGLGSSPLTRGKRRR